MVQCDGAVFLRVHRVQVSPEPTPCILAQGTQKGLRPRDLPLVPLFQNESKLQILARSSPLPPREHMNSAEYTRAPPTHTPPPAAPHAPTILSPQPLSSISPRQCKPPPRSTPATRCPGPTSRGTGRGGAGYRLLCPLLHVGRQTAAHNYHQPPTTTNRQPNITSSEFI